MLLKVRVTDAQNYRRETIIIETWIIDSAVIRSKEECSIFRARFIQMRQRYRNARRGCEKIAVEKLPILPVSILP